MPKGKRTDWDPAASAVSNARLKLPALVEPYFRAGRKLAGTGLGELHKFRLLTKRLRYTIEFFRFCYGPGLEDRLRDLRKIQDYLGAISDCESARELIEETLPARSRERADVEGLVALPKLL